MAAELVGTAYVAIRAVTSGLADDIKDGIKRGSNDAKKDSEKSGRDLGRSMGDGVGDGLEDRLDVNVSRAVNRTFSSSSVKRSSDDAGRSLSRRIADGFRRDSGDFSSKLSASLTGALNSLQLPGGALTFLALNALPLVAGAIQAVVAVGASLVAMLGFIVTAAAGAGVALAGLGGALAVSVLPILLAFKAETPALARFQARLKDFGKAWQDVGKAAQKDLLPGLEGALDSLRKLIPLFKTFGSEIGLTVGSFARMAAAILTSDTNLAHFQRVLDGANVIMGNLGNGVIALFDSIPDILAAAMPIAERFSESIETMLTNFNEFISGQGTEQLTATFDKWYTRLETIGSILSNVFGTLWNIFTAGADASDGLFDSLERITQGWQDWTGSIEGQNSLFNFFSTAHEIANSVWLIVKDIWDLMVAPLVGATDPDSIIGVLDTFRTEFLPAIADLATIMAQGAGPLMGDLMDAIGEFLGILRDNPELASGVLAVLGSTVWIFTAALEGLNEILKTDIGAKLGALLLGFLAYAKIASVLGLVSPAITIFTGALRAFFLVLAASKGTTIAGLFAPLIGAAGPLAVVAAVLVAIGGGLALLYFHFQPFRDLIDEMVDFVAGLDPVYWLLIGISAITFGPVIAFLGVLTAMNWDEIVDGITNFAESLSGMFDGLTFDGVVDAVTESLGEVGGAIGQWASDTAHAMPEAIGGIVDSIIGVLQTLPSRIGEAVSGAYSAITGWVIEVAPTIGRYLGIATGTVLRWVLFELPMAILNAIPKVLDAFLTLFGNVIEGTINFVMSEGPTILRTFSNIFESIPGVVASILDGLLTIIGTMLGSIPGLAVAALSTLGSFIVGVFEGAFPGATAAIQNFLVNVVNFFAGLPASVVGALASFGSSILGVFATAWSMLSSSVSGFILGVVNFFVGLPGRVVGALGPLSSSILGVFSGAWSTASSSAQTFLSNIVTFFQGLPGRLVGALSSLASSVAGVFSSAVGTVRGAAEGLVSNIVSFFVGFPGRIVTAISSIGSSIAGVFSSAIGTVRGAAGGLMDNVIGFFGGLPGRISSAISGAAGSIASGLRSAFKSAWNSMVGGLPSFSADLPGPLPSVSVSLDFLRLANGGIFDSPVFAQIAEAGREAVVPLTNPVRAIQLLDQSGLSDLIRSRDAGQATVTNKQTTVRTGPALLIQHATFNDPVTADIVAKKVLAAVRLN